MEITTLLKTCPTHGQQALFCTILAEKFWRRLTTLSPEDELILLQPKKIARHFMEPEDSLPPSQHLAACPYYVPHQPRPLFLIHFNIILKPNLRSYNKWSRHKPLFLSLSYNKWSRHKPLFLSLSYNKWSHHSITNLYSCPSLRTSSFLPIAIILHFISRKIFVEKQKIIKLLVMQFSPLPSQLSPLILTYLPQHRILEHPQPIHK